MAWHIHHEKCSNMLEKQSTLTMKSTHVVSFLDPKTRLYAHTRTRSLPSLHLCCKQKVSGDQRCLRNDQIKHPARSRQIRRWLGNGSVAIIPDWATSDAETTPHFFIGAADAVAIFIAFFIANTLLSNILQTHNV